MVLFHSCKQKIVPEIRAVDFQLCSAARPVSGVSKAESCCTAGVH